jgi:hypothetical protein
MLLLTLYNTNVLLVKATSKKLVFAAGGILKFSRSFSDIYYEQIQWDKGWRAEEQKVKS